MSEQKLESVIPVLTPEKDIPTSEEILDAQFERIEAAYSIIKASRLAQELVKLVKDGKARIPRITLHVVDNYGKEQTLMVDTSWLENEDRPERNEDRPERFATSLVNSLDSAIKNNMSIYMNNLAGACVDYSAEIS